ncbi:acetyl-CoA acetyltransferase IB [Neoconidiobolus thromboides FSU 785]|nr:acetyl-CoA acetyltransferase IB [Neoconidiobolus thromboides FSU 785]
MAQFQDVYIIASGRTPIGNFNSKMAVFSAIDLGVTAVQGVISKGNIPADQIEQLYFGNVLSANLGQNPARQVAIKSGLPTSTVATTINKVCASGLKAAIIGAQNIKLGEADLIVVGGMESMSNVPFYLSNVRKDGVKYGDQKLIDGLPKDGLTDAYDQVPMGEFAELCAKENNLTRSDSDDYAVLSYTRAQAAHKDGNFKNEIIPLTIKAVKKGQNDTVIEVDEDSQRFDQNKLRQMRPAFPNAGDTVTAPNASSLSDGAAALVLASGKWIEKAKNEGWKPAGAIYQILGWGDAECEPNRFTTAPSLAIPKALKHANTSIDQVDFFEINEAFSVVALANVNKLNLNKDKVNVFGGAVALGHPLGCSGARILVTLANVLEQKNGNIGVAGICNGGGGASAIVIKKANFDLPQSKI